MHEELKPYLASRKRKEPEDRAQYVASLETFAERMVDVLEISLPDVVLAEGVPAMSGDGFQNIRKVPGGIAIGGTNPVLVDRVGAQYLGLWNNAELAQQLGGHRTSPLIEVAARRYGVPMIKPELTGDGVAALEAPRPVFFKAIAPFGIPPAPAPAEAPTARAKHVTSAPVMDGKLEAAWQSAPLVSWQTDYSGLRAERRRPERGPQPPPERRTQQALPRRLCRALLHARSGQARSLLRDRARPVRSLLRLGGGALRQALEH
jgi:hypothetical protein